MPINTALLSVAVNAMQSAATYIGLHSAAPDATGSNQTTHTRVATGWTTSTNGNFSTLTGKAFTGGAANGSVTHVGFWSAATGGTFYGYLAVTGDATSNAAGEYQITSLSMPGSATG